MAREERGRNSLTEANFIETALATKLEAKPMASLNHTLKKRIQAVPACVRAVESAARALKSRGHNLVPWWPRDVPKAFELAQTAVFLDGGLYLKDILDHDIPEPLNAKYPHFGLTWIPVTLRHVLAFLTARIWPIYSMYLRTVPRNTSELRKVYEEILDYRGEFLEHWRSGGIDALICPANASVAVPHSFVQHTWSSLSYTFLYNLLDYPAGVVPVTKVTAADEEATRRSYPRVLNDENRWIKEANSTGSQGLPVGVQCVALPFQEELCLRLMNEIDIRVKSLQ